jgi:hypothetical protein
MPDYKDWLTPERLAETEIAWSKMDRSELIAAIMKHDPKTVVEYCCGTGWIPYGLPNHVNYVGIDGNDGCVAYATKKNPEDTREFKQADVRRVMSAGDSFDMALAFSCLKHMTLAEWDGFYTTILRSGDRTLTSIFRGQEREDESHGFPHTRVSMERVERLCAENNHRIVEVFTLPPLNIEPEPLVLTELIVAEPSATSEDTEFDL